MPFEYNIALQAVTANYVGRPFSWDRYIGNYVRRPFSESIDAVLSEAKDRR